MFDKRTMQFAMGDTAEGGLFNEIKAIPDAF